MNHYPAGTGDDRTPDFGGRILEALDLVIGSEGVDFDGYEHRVGVGLVNGGIE